MLIILAFGLGMVAFGIMMIKNPMSFSQGIRAFSEKPWFHAFEIMTRLIIGCLLLFVASETTYPFTFTLLAGILCFTSLFLIIIGEKKHRQFAHTTSKIGKHFRILGVLSVICGAGISYLGLA